VLQNAETVMVMSRAGFVGSLTPMRAEAGKTPKRPRAPGRAVVFFGSRQRGLRRNEYATMTISFLSLVRDFLNFA